MKMRIPAGKPLTLAALFICLLTAVHGEDWGAEEVETVFNNKCRHCHTVPDAESSFDRAWIDQVNRTA